MGDNSVTPGRAADLPAGYDEDDPYEGENLETYPRWWRENIKEFQEHNMRPYRPPQFKDGSIVPTLVKELQAKLEVGIRFQNTNPDTNADPHQKHDWKLIIDGEAVSTVPRYRAAEGYSVYDIDSATFKEIIRKNCP